MTVQTQYAACVFVANGVITDFEWPYDYDEAMGKLKAFQVDAENKIIQVFVEGSDFSISGKTVSFNVAPENGVRIMLDRHTYRGQQVHFMEGEDFPAREFENLADRFAMINQEQDAKLDDEISQRQSGDLALYNMIPTKTSELTNDSGFITASALPMVNNATITFTQGGVSKGSITLNQSSDETIALDAGGTSVSAVWGDITGTLADQTDLKEAIDAKQSTLTFDSAPTENSTNPVTSGGVYTALASKADSSSLSSYQTTANLVTSVDSSSTDSQYPSAKLFYDTCGDIETLINAL